MTKHVILFLAANPSSSSRLALDEECAAIERELRMTAHRDDFELIAAWVLAAQLPPAWFSTELAEAIGLDTEGRTDLVQLHLLERDEQGRYQMHRLLREFALAEEPAAMSTREAVIRGATKLLVSGDSKRSRPSSLPTATITRPSRRSVGASPP